MTAHEYVMYFDDGPSDITSKVRFAAEMFEDRTGRKPVECLVNPKDMDEVKQVDGITLVENPTTLPNHLELR